MAYLGVDIGGTFTDVVYLAEDGELHAAKTPSTPPSFDEGVLNGVDKIAALVQLEPNDLLAGCDAVLHGTTVATNAIVQFRGAKVGVLTTRGHRDTLRVMRASGKAKGVSVEQILHASQHKLPPRLVEPEDTREIDERIDRDGEVVVALDEEQLRDTVRALVRDGVQSIAACFLWSINNPQHELRAREIISEIAPDLYVSLSHEASSRLGEYERFTAAVINAFLGPETSGYMTRLKQGLGAKGLEGGLLIMQAAGGVTPSEEAASLPAGTIGSGPAGGVAASEQLAARRGETEVLVTDMGGTSFDVALIADGRPVRSHTTVVNQHEFFQPRTDIRSIGSGGGSIVWFDEDSQSLRVGPQSAGARPGPACYNLGGTEPTMTDANLVLGYLDPTNFNGGEQSLDHAAAMAALERVGSRLGMSAIETALAARRIINHQMADLIRQLTVERGMDPRDFAMYAYGGAGGLHLAGYLEELGCRHGVVPLGELSTTWSAYGCATSDVLHVHDRVVQMNSPFDTDRLGQVFDELSATGRAELTANGVPEARQSVAFSVEMKYPLQIHSIEVPLPQGDITPASGQQLELDFAERYDQLFGKGSALAGAGIEIVSCRAIARGELPQPALREATTNQAGKSAARSVWWHGPHGPEEIEATLVAPDGIGSEGIEGPAIVVSDTTTILVPPAWSAAADTFGNILLKQA